MPNVGRPSKGCKGCRERKVKCDQKRPSCSQCLRAQKECHGYRDPLAMMFKNESMVVARKAEKRYEELAKAKGGEGKSREPDRRVLTLTPVPDAEVFGAAAMEDESGSTREVNTDLTSWSRYPTPESMTRELAPSVEQLAQGWFIANYVAQPGLIPRGQFEWVTELLCRDDVDEAFRESVKAVSLAGYANTCKSPAIMQKAQAAYVSAICSTNACLRDPKLAVKDSVLVSVIMLGVYENMIFRDKRSIEAWAKHVHGACTLINIRGPSQFKSSIARRIFHQFYGVALLVALETGTTVHDGLKDLYEDLRPYSDYEVHGRQWTTRIVEVMHDAINLNQDKQADPKTMIARALQIDRELDEVKALMPSIWHYETVYLDTPSPYHYGNFYSVYIDPWIVQMWNHLRSCRMYLYKAVRENIKRGCEAYDPPLFSAAEVLPQKLGAEEVMRATVAGIIASVPQVTGMLPFPRASEYRSFTTPDSGTRSLRPALQAPGTFLDPAKSPGMVHLVWPLYAAGQSDLATWEMREWCIVTLEFIARTIGTRQGVVLAQELRETQRVGKRTGSITDTLERMDFFFDRKTV
ncbi:hypothetical protein T440DRAFT_284488 [Plenodomus tracheiphilus IPT5]|uniref:Zn(2)-C6 fungal-type domain-containing protein n=1 Tax=Plenodomus tracheiphilus IPT5 TaxID=1408161 RepID=A0A6A7ASJ1_9PLEO|nr:hypothetical protein T440DRAFT_284488 [Plenodomus tracheiphilus IPT5]